MPTTVLSRSLKLGRLFLTLLKMKDSNALLTGCHVVEMLGSKLESGSTPMGQLFQHKAILQCFTEIEEMTEVSI